MPWARVYNHAFQGPTGQWYIENSLTTVGQKDPVSEYNSQLWNTGLESDKEIARKQKRKLQYFSNIYVVTDSKHPENEGKVFLFRYGKKIFDKLMAAMQPEFEDESPINPFDFWEGANFKLKIRKVDGYWNYDKSEFDKSSALFKDDAKIEEVWKSAYPLSEFTASTNFKSLDLPAPTPFVFVGVLTEINTISAFFKDSSTSDVKNKFLLLALPTISDKPGSYIGNFDKSLLFHKAILFLFVSTTLTVKFGHLSAKTVIVGPPTYPAPMQHTFLIS